MPPLHDPVDPAVRSRLREAVLQLRATSARGRPPAALHVGQPGEAEATFQPADGDLDHGARCDVVAALLRDRDPSLEPLTWLTRPGELHLHDLDAAWLCAAHAAHAEAGVPLTMVVITRQGWWDPRSDVRQTWKRLRRRS